MRIGIDAGPILGDRGGVGWHTYHLLTALLRTSEEVDWYLYVNPGARARHGEQMDRLVRETDNRAVRWIEAGRWGRRWRGFLDRLDLYHGTNFKMHTTGRCGGVVTIHDLWLDRYPQYSPKTFGQQASFRRTRKTALKARRVITVSEHSARDIHELYGVPRERIAVIPNAVSADFCPAPRTAEWTALRVRLGIPEGRFLLFVGGADPRKNHEAAAKAFALIADRYRGLSLVLVGDIRHRFADMADTVRAQGIGSHTVCTGRLPIEEIRLLYAHAAALLFPSIYEGFGMPVLEAMACGTPVITSKTTSLPEVAGDAALLVDPRNAEALADAAMRLLDDEGLQARLRAKGLQRAAQFTWERSAAMTVALYRELCGTC